MKIIRDFTWPAMVYKKRRINLKGRVALKERWDQSRWTPMHTDKLHKTVTAKTKGFEEKEKSILETSQKKSPSATENCLAVEKLTPKESLEFGLQRKQMINSD